MGEHGPVGDLQWDEVAKIFEFDGSLLDAYVFEVSRADWQHVIDVIRIQGWWFDYDCGDSPMLLPELVGDIFDHRGDWSTTLSIQPVAGIVVNTHFFSDDEVEFDFDPRELQGQEQIDVLCSFLRTIGRTLDKPVVLTPENSPGLPLITYVPSEDRLVVRRTQEDTTVS